MRGEKKSEAKAITGFGRFLKVWGTIFFLLSIGFIGAAMYLDVLPIKLFLGLTLFVVIICLLLMPPMLSIRFKKSRRVSAFVFSILFMLFYSLGIVYMTGTVAFFSNITALNNHDMDFFVIVRGTSEYSSLDNVKGEKVYTLNTSEQTYKDAEKEIKNKYSGKIGHEEEIGTLGDNLLNGEADFIMLSDMDYEFMENIAPGFKEKSKIIGTLKIRIQKENIAKKVDLRKDSFNIFISGLDTTGKITTPSRSDVNMVVTVNPITKKILLTSIPRDYRIRLTEKNNATDKMTHTGIYGIEQTVKSAEDLLGIEINYYTKVNFTTVKKFIDAIGGIDINSDRAFDTVDEESDNLHFKKGINHVDGKYALAYARERNAYLEGDLHRNQNQQEVLKAIIEKGTSGVVVMTKYYSIISGLGDYIETNLTTGDIRELMRTNISSMGKWTVEAQNLEGEGNSAQLYSTGGDYAYVMEDDEESIEKAVSEIYRIMEE